MPGPQALEPTPAPQREALLPLTETWGCLDPEPLNSEWRLLLKRMPPQNVPDMQVVSVDLDHLTFNTRGAQSQVHLQTRKPETGGPARLGPQFLTPDSRVGLPLPLIPGLLVGSLER